jgi:hypothetical protein
MHGLFKSKPPHVGLQYTLVRKDGTHIKVDASSSVLLDASGSPEALVCVVRENAPEKAPKEEVVAGTRGR